MSELATITAEAVLTGPQILTELQVERWHNAEMYAAHTMRQSLEHLDRVSKPGVYAVNSRIDENPYSGNLFPAEAIALRGVGIDPKELVQSPSEQSSDRVIRRPESGSRQVVTKGRVKFGGAALVVDQERGSEGLMYRVLAPNAEDKAALHTHLMEKVSTAFAESAAYTKVHDAIENAGENPESVTVRLKIDDDPQGVMAVLADAGLFSGGTDNVQRDVLLGKYSEKDVIADALEDRAEDTGQKNR